MTRPRYCCGTPQDQCTGQMKPLSAFAKSFRTHGSLDEAWNCQVRYLQRQGYKRVGQREFAAPGGGPVRVLTKKIRFGARLRAGKEHARHMPNRKEGGVVISS